MIGLIVTGHGNFATGITSSFRLITGESPDYEAVDFLPEDSIEMLTEKLKNAAAAAAKPAKRTAVRRNNPDGPKGRIVYARVDERLIHGRWPWFGPTRWEPAGSSW